MNSQLLNAEIEWVKNNSARYEGSLHIECVIKNITRRYKKVEILKALKGRLITHTNEQFDQAVEAVESL